MSQIVHEVRHFIVREGEGVPVPSHEALAAEAQHLAKGGHIVSMTVPGGNVVMVGPYDDPNEVTDRFQKALPEPKKADKPDPGKPLTRAQALAAENDQQAAAQQAEAEAEAQRQAEAEAEANASEEEHTTSRRGRRS